MRIRFGFEITLQCAQSTPVLVALSPRPKEVHRLIGSHTIHTEPQTPLQMFLDEFGNLRGRLEAPAGRLTLWSDCEAKDDGSYDEVAPEACQHPISELPLSTLGFLSPSRYCESDELAAEAWDRFGALPAGWARVQAICDFVHNHIEFGYAHADATRTAVDTLRDGRGVCRDFAHLAVAFCRALNVPARYASGYLGDIGVPYAGPGDFCAWFEAYLGGRWYTFDARYNTPRIGRILMVRGRDAADVAMITSFGEVVLSDFNVWTDEVARDRPAIDHASASMST